MLLKAFSTQHGTDALIQRALTYHPSIAANLYAIPVNFNSSLSTAAGNFRTKPLAINLHIGLNRAQHSDLKATFLHEVAHAMQWLRYHEINHGASWWEMMHLLAQKPQRCHQIAACSRQGTKIAADNPDDLGL